MFKITRPILCSRISCGPGRKPRNASTSLSPNGSSDLVDGRVPTPCQPTQQPGARAKRCPSPASDQHRQQERRRREALRSSAWIRGRAERHPAVRPANTRTGLDLVMPTSRGRNTPRGNARSRNSGKLCRNFSDLALYLHGTLPQGQMASSQVTGSEMGRPAGPPGSDQ